MNFIFLHPEKNVLCDYSQSNYVIAVQLAQNLSRGWMIVQAKFEICVWAGWVWWLDYPKFIETLQTSGQGRMKSPFKKLSQSVHLFIRYDLSKFG